MSSHTPRWHARTWRLSALFTALSLVIVAQPAHADQSCLNQNGAPVAGNTNQG
ncbi:hypothetical protein LDO26_03335 [Luteimonas sp. BDR2-5]|uniref:hypothetical protein n=1 Tax=Proluteimonas luteida TaxID=2878685 RepID=UPI001E54E494|nr:hypothetical protein [Luteimonas sp. BDR2-5]MCD9027248.1 hypothetical protein [Luteimonas sp. BDR2-5]